MTDYHYEEMVWYHANNLSGQIIVRSSYKINLVRDINRLKEIISEAIEKQEGIGVINGHIIIDRFVEYKIKKGVWHYIVWHINWEILFYVSIVFYLISLLALIWL